MDSKQHTVVESPYGALTLVARDGVLSGLYMTGQRHRPAEESFGERVAATEEPFPEVVRQLAAYFAGELTDFDLPLAPTGSAFQHAVWAQLTKIGYGETASYGQIAARLGKTNAASRAVGLANGSNPIPIVIPCHRVIGANGTLTGYAGGLPRKQLLLDLEQDALF